MLSSCACARRCAVKPIPPLTVHGWFRLLQFYWIPGRFPFGAARRTSQQRHFLARPLHNLPSEMATTMTMTSHMHGVSPSLHQTHYVKPASALSPWTTAQSPGLTGSVQLPLLLLSGHLKHQEACGCPEPASTASTSAQAGRPMKTFSPQWPPRFRRCLPERSGRPLRILRKPIPPKDPCVHIIHNPISRRVTLAVSL